MTPNLDKHRSRKRQIIVKVLKARGEKETLKTKEKTTHPIHRTIIKLIGNFPTETIMLEGTGIKYFSH